MKIQNHKVFISLKNENMMHEYELEDIIYDFADTLKSFDKIRDLKELDVDLIDYIYRLKLFGVPIQDISKCNSKSSGFFYAKNNIPNPYLKGRNPSELYMENGLIKFTRNIERVDHDLITLKDVYLNKDIETSVLYNLEPLFIDNNPIYERLLYEDSPFYLEEDALDRLDDFNLKKLYSHFKDNNNENDDIQDDDYFNDDYDEADLNNNDDFEDMFENNFNERENRLNKYLFYGDLGGAEMHNRINYGVHRLNLEDAFLPLQVNIVQGKFYELSDKSAVIVQHDAYSNTGLFFYNISNKPGFNDEKISLKTEFNFDKFKELDAILSRQYSNKREDFISFSKNLSDEYAVIKTNRQKKGRKHLFKDVIPRIKF